jgi:hypothetical protein
MHMSVAYHSCSLLALFHIYDDNIALITTNDKSFISTTTHNVGISRGVERKNDEYFLFESNDDDVERSEISGKEKLKKFAFHLLSCFSPFTWKKLIFSSLSPKSSCFKPQILFFLNAPCQYSSSPLSLHAMRYVQLPRRWRCEGNFISAWERSLLMEKFVC